MAGSELVRSKSSTDGFGTMGGGFDPTRGASRSAVFAVFLSCNVLLSASCIVAPYAFGHSAYGEYSVVYSVFWAKIGRF